MMSEMRKHARLPVREGVFAAFHSSVAKGFSVFGRVIDASEDGLGICYIQVGNELGVPSRLLLFTSGEHPFNLTLECKLIYEITFKSQDGLWVPFDVKRCGLQFHAPSVEVAEKVRYFIENFGIDAIGSSC